MIEKEKMLAGEIYSAVDPQLIEELTKDIPSNSIAVGNPCKVIKTL